MLNLDHNLFYSLNSIQNSLKNYPEDIMKFIYFLLLCVALCACERKSSIGGGDDATTKNASAQVARLQKKLDTLSKAGDGVDTVQVVKLQKKLDEISKAGDAVDTVQVAKLREEIDEISKAGADTGKSGPQEEVDEPVTVYLYCGCRRGYAWSSSYYETVIGTGDSDREAENNAKQACTNIWANQPARPVLVNGDYTDDPVMAMI